MTTPPPKQAEDPSDTLIGMTLEEANKYVAEHNVAGSGKGQPM